MKYTKRDHEQYLNHIYQDSFLEDVVLSNFIYLTNSNRNYPIRLQTLENHIARGTVGTMMRRYDLIAFETSYKDSRYKTYAI